MAVRPDEEGLVDFIDTDSSKVEFKNLPVTISKVLTFTMGVPLVVA